MFLIKCWYKEFNVKSQCYLYKNPFSIQNVQNNDNNEILYLLTKLKLQ